MATPNNPQANKASGPEHDDEGTSEKRMISDSIAFLCFVNLIRRGAVEKPTLSLAAAKLARITPDMVQIGVDAMLAKPRPGRVLHGDYTIESDGRRLGCGTIAMSILVIGCSGIIILPTDLDLDAVKRTWASVRPGTVIPYQMVIKLIGKMPCFGKVPWHLEVAGVIPVPAKPDVAVEEMEFSELASGKASATLHVKLVNKNDFVLGLNALRYELWMYGTSIVSAVFTQSLMIEKNKTAFLKILVSFSPKNLAPALWNVICGCDRVGYRMKGAVNAHTAFGKMKLPFITGDGALTSLKKRNNIGEVEVCDVMKRMKWM